MNTTPIPARTRLAQTHINPIRRAAVIGAGSMGSGIAALLASSGISVTLLDMPTDGDDRNARARAGFDLQLKRKGFIDPAFADNVTIGNIEDDLALLQEAEWIVEAVFENLEVKRDLYARIVPHLAEGAVLSSNTSTIPLADLGEDLEESVRRRLCITHFFNPPRVMNLVEVVYPTDAPDDITSRLTGIIAEQLGKVPLLCRDTPGFIANRIGNLWMAAAARLALDGNVDLPVADAVNQELFTTPRTGVFGLFDYIGLQLVPDVWGSFINKVPAEDSYHRFPVHNEPLITTLISQGLTGRTSSSGIYRHGTDPETSKRTLEIYNTTTGHYEPAAAVEFPRRGVGGRALLEAEGLVGDYARALFAEVLYYCTNVAEEICDSVDQIDAAMRHGYSWRLGPLELADDYGITRSAQLVETHLATTGRTVPALLKAAVAAGGFYPTDTTVLSSAGEATTPAHTLAETTTQGTILHSTDDADIVDLGDGIALWRTRTKKGSLTRPALDALTWAAAEAHDGSLRGLVLAHDDPTAFCAGADIRTLNQLAQAGDREGLREFLTTGINAFKALAEAPIPVVAAVRGVALGGGAELLLHTDAAVLHTDTTLSFPERLVGLFPGWMGPAQSLRRMLTSGHYPTPADAHREAFALNISAQPLRGAYALAQKGLLGEHDIIVASPDGVINAAIALARKLATDYQPQLLAPIPLYQEHTPLDEDVPVKNPDPTDYVIAHELATLLTGPGDATYDELAAASVHGCSRILQDAGCQERLHRQATGQRKPK